MIRKGGIAADATLWRNLPVPGWLYRLARAWERPLWAMALSLMLYTLLAVVHGSPWRASPVAYYNYLADAFLHGQLHLRLLPPTAHDLSLYHGRYYLYWSPMPAVLLMPLVALFGVQLSDVCYTLVLAALNVALVAALLRQARIRRVIELSRARRGLLVLCFALGTVHLTLASVGRVWHTGQLVGFMAVALCYLAVLRWSGAWAFLGAGAAIAAALLTRNHLVFAGIWPACYLLYRHRVIGLPRLLRYALLGLLPVVVAVGLLAAYDWLRFGSLLDNGLAYHEMAEYFVDDYQRYGAFNLHYLPINLFYQYVAYPFPLTDDSLFGGSLFLLTPVFAAAALGIARMRPRWSMYALLVSIVLVALPIALLMGTGWMQFGPRYTLDFTVPLLLLTACGLRRWPITVITLLTIVSIGQYVVGTLFLFQVL